MPGASAFTRTVAFPDQPDLQLFYSLKPPDYVTILAQTDRQFYIVLRQYRPILETYTFELPSGHCEPGETPQQAMIRELEEETGCRTSDIELLAELTPDTGRLENRLWAFFGCDLTIGELPDPQDNEGIEVMLVSRTELREMIIQGKMNHALDLSVIALAALRGHLQLH